MTTRVFPLGRQFFCFSVGVCFFPFQKKVNKVRSDKESIRNSQAVHGLSSSPYSSSFIFIVWV
jgi:hypothetical protein